MAADAAPGAMAGRRRAARRSRPQHAQAPARVDALRLDSAGAARAELDHLIVPARSRAAYLGVVHVLPHPGAVGLAVQGELFQVDSWLQVMLGQRLVPASHHLMGAQMPPEQLRAALDSLKGNIARAVARMPSHQAFLEQYAGIPAGAVPA